MAQQNGWIVGLLFVLGDETAGAMDRSDSAQKPSRALLVTALGLLALVLTAVMWVTLDATASGVWPFRSATPARIQFGERSYDRGVEVDSIEPGFVQVGETQHGGMIYSEPGSDASEPLGIQVADDEHVFWYGLVGGP